MMQIGANEEEEETKLTITQLLEGGGQAGYGE